MVVRTLCSTAVHPRCSNLTRDMLFTLFLSYFLSAVESNPLKSFLKSADSVVLSGKTIWFKLHRSCSCIGDFIPCMSLVQLRQTFVCARLNVFPPAAFHHVVDGASGPLWDGQRGHQHAVVQKLHRAAAADLPHGKTVAHTLCSGLFDVGVPSVTCRLSSFCSTMWPSSSTWEPWRTCCSPQSSTTTSWPSTSSSVPCSSETHRTGSSEMCTCVHTVPVLKLHIRNYQLLHQESHHSPYF